MKSIIRRLFEGEIFPAETAVPVNAEYRSAIVKVSRTIEELQEALTMEQNKKLDSIMDMNAEIATMESKAYYAEGVRFGVELMIEIYRMSERTQHGKIIRKYYGRGHSKSGGPIAFVKKTFGMQYVQNLRRITKKRLWVSIRSGDEKSGFSLRCFFTHVRIYSEKIRCLATRMPKVKLPESGVGDLL